MIFEFMAYKPKYDKKTLEQAIKQSFSIANVCRLIGLKPRGGNYKTLYRYIEKWNLDTSHFTGQGHNVGENYKRPKDPIPIEQILVENSTYTQSNCLKKRVLSAKILEYKCYGKGCNITNKWLGKKIVLELDHINGINNDNRRENLRLLCPNCHSQTKTFRGKNKK